MPVTVVLELGVSGGWEHGLEFLGSEAHTSVQVRDRVCPQPGQERSFDCQQWRSKVFRGALIQQ